MDKCDNGHNWKLAANRAGEIWVFCNNFPCQKEMTNAQIIAAIKRNVLLEKRIKAISETATEPWVVDCANGFYDEDAI